MFAYCRNIPANGNDPTGHYNIVNTWKMAYTDGENNRYYGTGATKRKEDQDRIKRIEKGKGVVYLYNTKYTEVRTKETTYTHPEKTSPVISGAISFADDILLSNVLIQTMEYSTPEMLLVTGVYSILKTCVESYSKERDLFKPGESYVAYEVYVSGYMKDSLTGLWTPFTDCYTYAFATDSHGTEYAFLVDAS